MERPDFALRVSGLSKKYTLQELEKNESLFQHLRGFITKKRTHTHSKEFYALRDIDFTIKTGESVGIIGRNGAGKSTLLKILSQVTEPTAGKLEINGKLASVLEIGMGFHPELTGRENVFLSGIMLGISKKQIEKCFDDIVKFAEVESFIETPVKHYSNGMYLRLAFSLVTHINADILLFDEVLGGVGDLGFNMKIYDKIEQLLEKKNTMVLVSHDLSQIQRYCQRFILLEDGCIKDQGGLEVIMHYFEKTITDNAESKESIENEIPEVPVAAEESTNEDITEKEPENKEVAGNEPGNGIIAAAEPVIDPAEDFEQQETILKNSDINIFEPGKHQPVNINYSDILKREDSKLFPPAVRTWDDIEKAPGNTHFSLKTVRIYGEGKDVSEPIYVSDKLCIEIEFNKLSEDAAIDLGIVISYLNTPLLASITSYPDFNRVFIKKGNYGIKAYIKPYTFNYGIFSLSVSALIDNMMTLKFSLPFKIVLNNQNMLNLNYYPGPLLSKLEWDIESKDNTE